MTDVGLEWAITKDAVRNVLVLKLGKVMCYFRDYEQWTYRAIIKDLFG